VWLHQHRNQKLGVNVINQLIKIKSQNLGPKKDWLKWRAYYTMSMLSVVVVWLVGWDTMSGRKKKKIKKKYINEKKASLRCL